MFKGVVSRLNGDPWPSPENLDWQSLPTRRIQISDLIATQEGVYFHALAEDYQHRGRDPFPRVVLWHGEFYLEDGHSRTVKAALRGIPFIEARILDLDSPS